MKRLLLSIAATLALAATAMPTREEQKAAASIVGELMNPLVADFRAKKKTAVEVGDAAMAYAKEANTEAAKFLLLKGAIWYFAQAKEDAKAVDAITALGEQVKDLPPEVMRNDVIKPAIDHVSEQNVPGLFAQFRSASAQMEIVKLGPSVRRNRADEPTRRRYAELLVVTGDWKAALEVFAKLEDAKAAKAAKDEIDGKTLAPAGDFWWDYTPTEPTAADAIKAHAVALYRKAIASGELTGLKKVVAEKRIASVPFADRFNVADAPQGSAAPAASGKQSNALYCVIDLSAGPTASKYPVKWLDTPPPGGFNVDEYKTTKLVLRRIEPGTFKMGRASLSVTLTKPYYMAVFEMTQKQYSLVTGSTPSQAKKGDMRPVENVSWNMTRGDSAVYDWPKVRHVAADSFAGRLSARTGLSFDLPTEAQWEYACRAGTTSRFNNGGDSIKDRAKVGRFKDNREDGKGGFAEHTAVGSYLPNAWGLYDMHGNVNELCLNWWTAREFEKGGVDPLGPIQSRDERHIAKYGRAAGSRTHRGGCWYSLAEYEGDSVWRIPVEPELATGGTGFRLCMNPEGPVGASAQGSAVPAVSGKQSNALYCVIDLSAGPTASKYPVKWLDTPPPGGFNVDEYKTTKLVLRRIEPGTFKMRESLSDTKTCSVKLTKRFYIGIFESTQKQYELVMGENPSEFKGAMRPVDKVSWNQIRGDSSVHDWPTVKTVDANSFMGRIRARTGLLFDLPTEAQWEYACRAGTTSRFNNGGDITAVEMKELGRSPYSIQDGKGGYAEHTVVGLYLPNAWGLYDMHGNVFEWCLDWWARPLQDGAVDPQGPMRGELTGKTTQRTIRSGDWKGKMFSSDFRTHAPPSNTYGFRLCMNLK